MMEIPSEQTQKTRSEILQFLAKPGVYELMQQCLRAVTNQEPYRLLILKWRELQGHEADRLVATLRVEAIGDHNHVYLLHSRLEVTDPLWFATRQDPDVRAERDE